MQSDWSRLHIGREDKDAEKTDGNARSTTDPVEQAFRKYFGKDSDVVWTQGRTVNLSGAEQLVVYRAAFPANSETEKWFESHFTDEMKAVENDNEKFMNLVLPLAREFLDTVPLRASLINVGKISAINDVEKFDYDATFAAFGREVREREGASDRQRAQNRAQSSRTSLQSLKQGFDQYILDYDEVLPPLANWEGANKALQPYIKSEIKLAQPNQKIYTNPLLSFKKLAHLQPYAQSLIVFYSDPDQSGNRWAVFLDGNVEEIDTARWPQIKKAARLP